MKKSNLKRLLQVALLAVLLVAVSAATVSASGNLTVHFIDVGQGDSELLQFAGKNVLIDGGIPEVGQRVDSLFAQPWGLKPGSRGGHPPA